MKTTRCRAGAVLIAAAFGLAACTTGSKSDGPASSAAGGAAAASSPGAGSSADSSAAAGLSGPSSPGGSELAGPLPVPSSAGPPPTPAELPHIDEATLEAFYTQKLAWHDCDNGFQCAALTVPLDYAHPTATSIHLAVLREQSNATSKLGSVILNPGGPGGSGIGYAQAAAPIIGEQLGGKFDVVSFDPRGVGSSAPIRCLTSQQLDQWVAFEADPTSPSQVAEQDGLAKTFAAGCVAKSGALLAHVSTVDTARDLDVLRAALGDPKLTYIGASYGTFLGAIYAQLFPTHVRALVLDGALDPSASASELNHVQTQGFEVALQSYIASCVKSSKCPLGTSSAAAEPRLDSWIETLRSTPIHASTGRTLTRSLAVQGVAAALYSPTSWGALTAALTSALKGDAVALLALSDQIDGRHPDGSYDNLIESNSAINCVDRPGLGSGIDAYAREAAAGAKDGPTFGEFIDWGNVACADWPVAPELAPGPVNPVGAPPILVIGTLRDPATPYRWAQALAKQVNGPLLSYDGDGHTAFLRSACVDAVVKSYLVSLKTPAAGMICK